MRVELFNVGIDTLIIRYNLMIAVVVIGVATGWYWIAALALPLFLSCITGMKFTRKTVLEAKTSTLNVTKKKRLAA